MKLAGYGLVVLGAIVAGCGAPTRVRIQFELSPDAATVTSGPVVLNLYGAKGRLFENQHIDGSLPGDLVVLVDDDVGELRAWARVVHDNAVVAAGTGRMVLPMGIETRLPVTLSTALLVDSDGDGVPDAVDDCPTVSDVVQQSPCGSPDMAQGSELPDLSVPLDGASSPDLLPPCGNGTVDPGEACDDGANNSDDPTVAATCTTKCNKRAPCGTLTGSTASLIDPASGHCYALWPTAMPWASAENDCLTRGGHLAAITTASENLKVKSLIGATTIWIGVTNAGTQTTWSTGESKLYDNFKAGEPSLGATGCVVALGSTASWESRPCGYPAVGDLPASTASNLAYLCENSCGNGVIDSGEECDPPGATCTTACRTKRTCTEPGGMVSSATGRCYFVTATAVTYPNALSISCPAGTHLATPTGPMETATAIGAMSSDSWIAVSAPTTAGVFQYDAGGFTLDTTRYHGFLTPDPDQAAPAGTVISKDGVQPNGWRDRAKTLSYPAVCERD